MRFRLHPYGLSLIHHEHAVLGQNLLRADVEVKEALILGRVIGNIRALGVVDMRAGSKVEGDVTAISVVMEPGVYFSGRCTMLENGSESVEMSGETGRMRETVRG